MIIEVKPNISLIDKSFREDHTRNLQLTIQLSLDGFSLAVYHSDKQRFVGLQSYRFQDINNESKLILRLDELFMVNQWITYPFQSVVVVIDHLFQTLVPFPLYDENEKESYLLFNHQPIKHARVEVDSLKNANANNVYYLSDKLAVKIKEYWANARLVHLSSVLIESLLIQHKNKPTDNYAFVNLRSRSFDLIILRHDKLHFYNSYKFNTKEDYLYFLLFALEQLNMNPESVELVIMGNLTINSDIYELSWKYIRNIRFMERNNIFQYSYVFDDLPGHQYYTLFNALQCEL